MSPKQGHPFPHEAIKDQAVWLLCLGEEVSRAKAGSRVWPSGRRDRGQEDLLNRSV